MNLIIFVSRNDTLLRNLIEFPQKYKNFIISNLINKYHYLDYINPLFVLYHSLLSLFLYLSINFSMNLLLFFNNIILIVRIYV